MGSNLCGLRQQERTGHEKKVGHSTDRYRSVIWRCNCKYNGEKCQTPHVTARKEIIANVEFIRRTLCDTNASQEEKRWLESEMAVLVDIVNNYIAENARIAPEQVEYPKR